MTQVCKKAHSSNRFEQEVVDEIKSCHESRVVRVEHDVVVENMTIRRDIGQLEWRYEHLERPDHVRLNVECITARNRESQLNLPENQRNTDDVDENIRFVRVVCAIKDKLKMQFKSLAITEQSKTTDLSVDLENIRWHRCSRL